jgi:hypothetical protein
MHHGEIRLAMFGSRHRVPVGCTLSVADNFFENAGYLNSSAPQSQWNFAIARRMTRI